MSVFENGKSALAAVNRKPKRYSYDQQPVRISASSLWKALFGYGEAVQYRKTKSYKGTEFHPMHSFISIRPRKDGVEVRMPNMSKDALKRFWEVDSGRQIYRLVTGTALTEDLPEIRKDLGRIRKHPSAMFDLGKADDAARLQTLMALLDQHGEVELKVAGTFRDRIREVSEIQQRPQFITWTKVVSEGGNVAGLVEAAETNWQKHSGWHGDQHNARISLPVLAMTGRSLPGPASIQLTGGDLTLVSLPSYSRNYPQFLGISWWQGTVATRIRQEPAEKGTT